MDPMKSSRASVSIDEAIEIAGSGPAQWIMYFVVGMVFIADAAEVTFLSFASEQLKCEWNLTDREESTIASAVFVGIGVGACAWGNFADWKGRRPALLLATAMISFLGALTAATQNYWQLLTVRFFTGFGVAGIAIAFDILAEACDVESRGRYTMILNYWWTGGCLYVNLCAWLFMNSYGWRGLALLAALPPFCSLVCAICLMPESPRWLVIQNRMYEAVDIINHWANQNGVEGRPITALDEDEEEEGEAGCMEVWRDRSVRKDYWLLSVIWPCFGLAYYGIVMLLPRLFEGQSGGQPSEDTCNLAFDFKDLAISCTAEALGVMWAAWAVNRAGRKLVQSIGYSMCGTGCLFMMFPGTGKTFLTVVAAIGRNGIMAASCCTWVHTPELFPTRFRTTAHGLLNATARIGAFLAPFLIQRNVPTVVRSVVMAAAAFTAAVAALFLTETTGKAIGKAGSDDGESSDDESSSGSEF